MKNIFLMLGIALPLVLLVSNAKGQEITETQVSYQKQNVTGFQGTYNVPQVDLEAVAEKYFYDQLNAKRSKNSGFYHFSNVHWDAIPLPLETLFYKVSGNKRSSTLTILISKSEGTFISSKTEPDVAHAIKKFFSDFNQNIAAYDLSQKIKNQKDKIEKLQKEHDSEIKKDRKLKRQLNNLQQEIEDNQKDYQSKAEAIEKNKQILLQLQQQK